MELLGDETCPLPEDPLLAEVAAALNAAGTWGFVVDPAWRLVHMTDEMRLSNGRLRELVPLPLGAPYFGREALDVFLSWSGGQFTIDAYRAMLRVVGPWMLEDLGGRDALLAQVDPRLADIAEAAEPPVSPTAVTFDIPGRYTLRGTALHVLLTALRVRDTTGRLAGTGIHSKPAAGMSVLGTIAAAGDLGNFRRMQSVARAARRPAAILFGDLEGSSPLARRLSTASYFALGRRLVRAADQSVVDQGGMVGRHAGDGFVAFFLAEHAGSESAAARACISAMRSLRAATADVAQRSGLAPEDVSLRFGLHWGATLHVGQIASVARVEADALGDEMNEAARIEACATGGRALASKALVERLEPEDAAAVGIDPGRVAYQALSDLPSATEKARRDAPAIAVCEI